MMPHGHHHQPHQGTLPPARAQRIADAVAESIARTGRPASGEVTELLRAVVRELTAAGSSAAVVQRTLRPLFADLRAAHGLPGLSIAIDALQTETLALALERPLSRPVEPGLADVAPPGAVTPR
jgi:hypothetical protein